MLHYVKRTPSSPNPWNITLVPLKTNVGTGSEVKFIFTLTAPVNQNTYSISFRMQYINSSGQKNNFGATLTRTITVYPLPAQFIAKLYTEALGRIPDPPGWKSWLNYYVKNGCNLTTLKSVGVHFFNTAEFTSLNYDNESKIIALYRSALGRDPDPTGFVDYLFALNNGTSFSSIVDLVFSSSEFNGMKNEIFSGGSYRWRQNASSSYSPTINTNEQDPTCTEVFSGGDGSALQVALNRHSPGSKVCIPKKMIVPLFSTLVIPPGVALSTVGAAAISRTQYAMFGRLIRGNSTIRGFALVNFRSQSSMENVWVDGQETSVGRVNRLDFNLQVQGVTDVVSIRECKISDAAGATNLEIGWDCTRVSVLDNLITCYTSQHWTGAQDTWTDGISCGGPSTTVDGNHIVDPTDVGIVMFAVPGRIQASRISNNLVLGAGNSVYAGIGIDQFLVSDGSIRDFTGSVIENNVIWTGPNTHMDIGFVLGSRPWWDSRTFMGSGATVRNNTSANQTINCNIGIALNNMNNATVQNNVLSTVLQNTTGMPLVNVLVQTNGVHPTTNIQPFTASTDDASFDAKIFHSQ